jgi:hypothetical protein
VSIGVPVDLSVYRDKEVTPAMLREITDVIMHRLREDVADLRGLAAPHGDLYRWSRRGRPSAGAA